MDNERQQITSKELATKAVMHALMRAGIKVNLANPKMFAEELFAQRNFIEKQIADKRIGHLHFLSEKINKWAFVEGKVKNDEEDINLPLRVKNRLRDILGKHIQSHNIDLYSVRHIFNNHGINGRKLNDRSIPLRKDDLKLIPFILTAPDNIEIGSMDERGRESIKFKKYLSNGYVVVVEKEKINDPQAMGTTTMWAETSSNVSDARKIRPLNSTSETVVIGLDDIAKIIKDAENAIREDVKNQIDKHINYFYGFERFEMSPYTDIEDCDILVPCRKGNVLYGWTFNNQIYLTPEGINPETPVHEYTHLWANAMMIRNPDQWDSIKSLLSKTQEWHNVYNDPLYTAIREDEDRIASETLARLSGRENMKLLDHYAYDTLSMNSNLQERSLIEKLLDNTFEALRQFWNWVSNKIFRIPELQVLSQITDKILFDLLDGVHLPQDEIRENNTDLHIVNLNPRVTDVQIKTRPDGNKYISCRIDGIQQMAERIKDTDLHRLDILNGKNLLAEKYFQKALDEEPSRSKSFRR